MHPLRIAHVNPSFYPAFAYGGPTESGFETARHLARLGHEVRVLTTNANGRRQTTSVVTTRELELEPRLKVRYCKRVIPESVAPRVLTELPALVAWADIVHLTAIYNFTTFPALIARALASKPLVWTPRGALLRQDGGRRSTAKLAFETLARPLLRSRCAVHTTSEREAIATRKRLPNVPVFVVPNGVSCPAEFTHRASDEFRLMVLGRIDPIKGLEHLIDGLVLVERDGPRWSLAIVGQGDDRYVAGLRQRVAALGLSSRVRFEGPLDPRLRTERFADVDTLVSASHSENFGLSVAEALAHGVPVIASQGTPWSGLAERGAGLWVPNSPESLARAVEVMRRMSTLDRQAMGANGRKWMLAEYSWPAVAERLGRAFENLCASASVGAPQFQE